MIKQISAKEALERYLSGEDVKVLQPIMDECDWESYRTTFLSSLLDGNIYFADEVVEEEPNEPETVEETAQEEPEEPAEENPENAETIPAEEQKTPEKPKKEKKVVDHDRIMLLIANGKKPQEVAEEVGCHVSSVYNVINRYK